MKYVEVEAVESNSRNLEILFKYQVCVAGFKEAKTYEELNLAKCSKVKKKGFCRHLSSRTARERMGPSWSL